MNEFFRALQLAGGFAWALVAVWVLLEALAAVRRMMTREKSK